MLRARRGGMRASLQSGLTVMEMLIVVSIISLMAGLTFPSITSGIDSLRLRSSADSVAGFLTQAMARVERSQQPVELTFHKPTGRLELRTMDPAFDRTLDLPEGVALHQILPPVPVESNEVSRSVVLLPGATFPQIGVELLNRRGSRRVVRIDPMAAVSVVEIPAERVSGEER